MKINILPRVELVPGDLLPYQISRKAPNVPLAIPKSLFLVSCSFSLKKLMINTNTGVVVIIIDASMGEVKLKP